MRKLSVRERVLLVILAVVVVISAYVLLFYLPLTRSAALLREQITQSEELSAQMEVKLAEQSRMARQVALWNEGGDGALPEMPAYDNLHAVMAELNAILSGCQEYSLSFQTDSTQGSVLRRIVTIPFRCASYDAAEDILRRLHDSSLRAHLSSVDLTRQDDGSVQVTAVMIFYEYDAQAAAQDETESED